MAMTRLILSCIAVCVLANGCLIGGLIDKLDNAADCNTICNRYEACVDGDQDLVACVERCQDQSDSEQFMDMVDDCNACIDSNSCDITMSCRRECAGVMP